MNNSEKTMEKIVALCKEMCIRDRVCPLNDT